MKNINPLYIKIGVGLLIVVSLLFNFKQCNSNKIANSNIIALTDTIKTTKNKVGEVVKSKNLLLMDIKDLKNSNSGLTKEIDKLNNKDKRNLVEIDKLNITIDMLQDSIINLKSGTPIVVNDSTKIYPFSKINSFRNLQWDVTVVGKQVNSVSSKLTSDKLFMDLVIDKKKEGSNLILSVSSSNPYVKVTNIEGSIINLSAYNSLQKAKPFGIGLQVGYGIGGSGFTPFIAVGLSYNIIRF